MRTVESRRVLIVEDDPAHLSLMASAVRSLGVTVEEAVTAGSALASLARNSVDLVLLDVALPDLDGFELHRSIRGLRSGPRVVFVTANDLVERGVTAVLDGAANYVVKRPNYLEVVVRVVSELLGEVSTRNGGEALSEDEQQSGLIGESAAIRSVRQLIDEFAGTDATVLVCGETGTGKELVARALHQDSRRGRGRFVAVNCASIPESLVESELFGARKGSYTGLQHDRRGLVGEARGGTLFLDEIGELTLATQAKLLRLLERGVYRQVGGTDDREANVRFIAATNRDLRSEVRRGRFRSDLYFRLNVLRIDLPRLVDRQSDIPLLVRRFLSEFGAEHAESWIQESGWRQLISARWPGNVRELRHTVQRTLVRWRGGPIARFDIDAGWGMAYASEEHGVVTAGTLRELLAVHHGRLGDVAEELGVSVRTVQRRMRAYGLELREFRSGGRDENKG